MWWVTVGFVFVGVLVALTPGSGRGGFHPLGWVMAMGAAVCLTWQAATTRSSVVDRDLYLRDLEWLSRSPTPWTMQEHLVSDDVGFSTVLWVIGRVVPAPTEDWLFGSIGAVMALCLTAAYRLVLPWWGVALAWWMTLQMGFALAYSTVTIRHGLALGVGMVAVGLYVRQGRRWDWRIVGLVVAAATLHWSALAFGAALIAVAGARVTTRALWVGWFALAIAFLTNSQRLLLGPVAARAPDLDIYTAATTYAQYGAGGNRLTLLAVILAGAALARLGAGADGDGRGDRLVRAYLAWSAVFLAFGFVAYSDRLAAWSIFLLPVLVFRPLCQWTAAGVKELVAMGSVVGIAALGAFLVS